MDPKIVSQLLAGLLSEPGGSPTPPRVQVLRDLPAGTPHPVPPIATPRDSAPSEGQGERSLRDAREVGINVALVSPFNKLSTMTSRLDELLTLCVLNGRVSPMPQQWTDLWEMLPNKARHGGGWEPPLPLILGGWWETSDSDKRNRLELHVRWAAEHRVLDRVGEFLRSLPENQWHHIGD